MGGESIRTSAGLGLFGALCFALGLMHLGCGSGSDRMRSVQDLPPPPADDGGIPDTGRDGGIDAGTDGGLDGGPDGGIDGGVDGGSDGGINFGGPGPWPIENHSYGAADGILESPVVGFTTDETQNRWVATHDALYLLRPGQTTFHRYAAADGLHLQSNPAVYCDARLPGGDHLCPIYGAAVDPGITEIVGGGPNEVFVGYAGHDEGTGEWDDPNRHTGKLDRVRLLADGTIQVDRIDMCSGAHGGQYWHNRTVERMIYDHFIHLHELYVGTNHGVDLMRPDRFRYPRPDEWFDTANLEFMADHLHPRVCYHRPCDNTESNQRMGDWRGLALAPDGELWVAGMWTAGKIRWDPDLLHWFSRPGEQAFSVAFGDPYPVPPNDYGFINQPVFMPPLEGDHVSISAVAVAPDGKVWFSGGALYNGYPDYGIAYWDGHTFHYYDPQIDLEMPERGVRDLIALPTGQLVVAGPNSGLTLWNPATGAHQALRAPQWLPDDRVLRLELDKMVSPPALHVSTSRGATVLRVLP